MSIHDNARANAAALIKDSLRRFAMNRDERLAQWKIIELAPSDYHYLKLKKFLEGKYGVVINFKKLLVSGLTHWW